MDHEEHLYQLNSRIINLKGRPSVNCNQKKTAAQQARRNRLFKTPTKQQKYSLHTLLGKKERNTRQIITSLYLEDPE